jgi:hypothetical protein
MSSMSMCWLAFFGGKDLAQVMAGKGKEDLQHRIASAQAYEG